MTKPAVTIKQLYSFLYRIEHIEKSVQEFPGGQKYIEQKALSQLSNIVESVKCGSGSLGSNLWSVHNMVQIGRIVSARTLVLLEILHRKTINPELILKGVEVPNV